jgi:hypothetical protein
MALALLLGGCTRIETRYAPPIQRIPASEWAGARLKHYVSMDHPNAMDYVLEQVVPALESGGWRWTLQKPAFQFLLPTTESLKLRVDLTVPEITLQQTGPVTISFLVEDRLLDKATYAQPGNQRFLKPVPEDWLTTDRPVLVRLEIDKMWKSPADGIERGFIISGLGFVE